MGEKSVDDQMLEALRYAVGPLSSAAFGSWAPEDERPEFRVAFGLVSHAIATAERASNNPESTSPVLEGGE